MPLATPNQGADTMIVQVVPEGGPTSDETRALVADLRDLRPQIEAEHGVTIAVTGSTAVGIDVSDRLLGALLPFVLLVVGLSLVLLAMVFRSVWVPVKAAVGYLLSIGAALGAVVAVYQWGWLEGPLHTVDTGPVISFMPILLLGILFGLAMDYEVFLVSRIREHHVHGTPAREAVRTGFTSAAKVVAAAAVIMFAVFAAFVPEGDATLQPIALGLAVGVFVDAFLVRMTLVPAVLALLGERAWWLPGWLDRALPSFDVEGEGIAHQLRLQDWPAPGRRDRRLRRGRSRCVDRGRDGDRSCSPRRRCRVPPGHLLVVEGPDRVARTALAMVLAGRTRPDARRRQGRRRRAPAAGRRRPPRRRPAPRRRRARPGRRGPAAARRPVARRGRGRGEPRARPRRRGPPGRRRRGSPTACRDLGTAVVVTCDPACADGPRRRRRRPRRAPGPRGRRARPGTPTAGPAGRPARRRPEHDAPVPSLVGGPRP